MSERLTALIASLKTVDDTLAEIICRDKQEQPLKHNIFERRYIFDRTHRYLYANIPGADKLGLTPEEVSGRHWTDLGLPRETMEVFDVKLDVVFRTGCSLCDEVKAEYHTARGLMVAEYSLNPLFDETGQVEAVLCTVKDITEQNKNWERYLQEVAKLRQIIAAIPLPLVEIDKNNIVQTVNDSFFLYDFKGHTKEELIGQSIQEFMNDHNCDYSRSGLPEALAGISTHQRYDDVHQHIWLMSAVPIRDASTGEVSGALGIFEDITEHERKKVESDRRQAELLKRYHNENSKLSQLIQLCTVGIVLVDGDGIIEAINDSYCDIYLPGINKESIIGKHYTEITKVYGTMLEKTMTYNALNGNVINNKYWSNGDKSLLLSAIPIHDEEGQIVGGLSMIYDISEHEKLVEEVKKLDRLNVIGEMAAGVAHEIRNPMTVINGYLQRFQQKCHTDCPMRHQITIVLEELGRVESIVANFLSLANNKASLMAYHDLNKLIYALEPLIASDAAKHDIELRMELSPDIPLIKFDEKEVKQLVINLSRNAIEAMTKHGVLTLRTKLTDDGAIIEVADTGPGISPENSEHIFRPFFTTKDNGTGLGLSICARIVERHGGRIAVQSNPGEGTCFKVKFPCLHNFYGIRA